MATGRIPLIGIPGSALGNVGGQAVAQAIPSTFVPYVGSSLNQIAGGATDAVVNIGISSVLGAAVAGESGFDLTAGQNFLSSQVTPFLTNTLAQGVNVSVTNALQSAGPLAPVLGNLAGQAISGLAQTVAGSLGLQIPGQGAAGGTGPSRAYPGAGGQGEEPADYNGNSYNLGNGGPDVVFSILPANSGPQSAGVNGAQNDPTTAVSQSSNQVTNAANLKPPGVLSPREIAALRGTPSNNNPASAVGITAVSTRAGGGTATGTRVLSPREATQEKVRQQLGSQLTTPEAVGVAAGIANAAAGSTAEGGATGSPAAQTNTGAWTFIVAPSDIDWSTNAEVSRVPIFGSNQAPVIVGAKGMRELTLTNALVEGFTRGVSVEGKIAILEDMLNYELNTSQGFVNVPLYKVSANEKYYGAGRGDYDRGIFAIKEVRVKEVMRDLKGNTTRASVDISLTQVPPYQVDSGRDQADVVASTGFRNNYLAQITANQARLRENLEGKSANPQTREGSTAPKPAEPPPKVQGSCRPGQSGCVAY